MKTSILMASVMTAGLGLLASSQSEAQPLSPAQAEAEAAVTPYVTPRVDVDVTYDATGPDGQHYRQRMRWNAAHWQQRIDIEATGLIMLTDYRAHRLSVVDTRTKSYSVSGSPDAQFAPPGTRAAGSWQRGAPDIVAGQGCTHWSTTDTDGQAGDFCYSDDGVLLSAAHDGTEIIRAVSYVPAAQGPDVFVEPSGFHETSPVRLDH